MAKLLESGRDLERFNLENINATNQSMIETLNDQVDFLNAELAQKDAAIARTEAMRIENEGLKQRMTASQVRLSHHRLSVCTAHSAFLCHFLRWPCTDCAP